MSPRAPMLAALVAATALGAACEPYRIEYHRRPGYYQQLVDGPLPDRVELEDGTVMVYNQPPEVSAGIATGEDPKLFKIREETEDGEIILRALLPEHLVTNTLNCLRLEEYDLLWDQLVAEQTKRAYEAEGLGADAFAAFFREHRLELAKMLNRMRHGLATNDVVVDNRGDGVVVCRFWPQIATLFKYRKVLMVREGMELKLLMIE